MNWKGIRRHPAVRRGNFISFDLLVLALFYLICIEPVRRSPETLKGGGPNPAERNFDVGFDLFSGAWPRGRQ